MKRGRGEELKRWREGERERGRGEELKKGREGGRDEEREGGREGVMKRWVGEEREIMERGRYEEREM